MSTFSAPVNHKNRWDTDFYHLTENLHLGALLPFYAKSRSLLPYPHPIDTRGTFFEEVKVAQRFQAFRIAERGLRDGPNRMIWFSQREIRRFAKIHIKHVGATHGEQGPCVLGTGSNCAIL